jgi:hypothetical protein
MTADSGSSDLTIADAVTSGDTALVTTQQRGEFKSRWQELQTLFVDEPRGAVDGADALVAEVVDAVSAGFADRKAALEQRWASGGDVATEELRQSLRAYRAFFERLLQI